MATFSLNSHPLPSFFSPPTSRTLILYPPYHWNPSRLASSQQIHSRSTTVCSSSLKERDTFSRNFCIIEGPENVQDFVQMQLQEIEDNIKSRRNKIFLLMEEVRRLCVQQRIRSVKFVNEKGEEEEEANEMPDIPSSIPFLPRVTTKTLKQLYMTSLSLISGIILFGGLIAPT